MKRFGKGLKKRIKVILEKHFTNLVCEKISNSVELLSREDYDRAFRNDKKIIKILLIAETFHIKTVNLPALIEYVKALDAVTLYQRDTMENNKSATLFSNDLINEGVTSRILKTGEREGYINGIIILNMRMARMDSYRTIYNKYVKHYNDEDKATIVCKLLGCYCGDISYHDEVIPLMENFNKCVEKQEEKINQQSNNKKKQRLRVKLTNYIRNMLSISNAVFYEIPRIEQYVCAELRKYYGSAHFAIISLAKEALKHDRCVEEVREWLNSIDGEEKLDRVSIIKSILDEIDTGELQDKKETRKFVRGEYSELTQALQTRNYPKDMIVQLCETLEDKYTRRILGTKSLTDKIKNLELLFKVKYKRRIQVFWKQFDHALSKVDSVDCSESETVFFFPSDWNVVNGAYAFPILLAAKKRGCVCVPSTPMLFNFSCGEDEELGKIAGSKYYNTYTDKIDSMRYRYNWTIDIENKIIEAEGLNVYQPIYEVISRWQFSCFFNFETNAWARARVNYFINMFEKTFYQCELLEEYARSFKKKIRIVATSPHVQSYAGYRIYCEEKGCRSGMEFICVRSGYDDYFNNSHRNSAAQTITALNLTRNPNSRTSIYGTPEEFEQYYRDNEDNFEAIYAKAMRWFEFQRSTTFCEDTDNHAERQTILNLIKKYKTEGKKVYLLNGKIVFDLAVKYTKGCAHSDMSDWVTHIVNTVKRNNDVLLLIKPHPHESDRSITMTDESIVTLKDTIRTELGENTVYMDNSLFRNIDLAPYIDAAFTWNGTSSLELSALGVKVVMGDEWGYLDYPVGFLKLNSAEEYERFINDPDKFEVSGDVYKKALIFLDFIGSEIVNVKNKYSVVTASNYNVFKTKIDMQAVEEYITNGDEDLERLFDKVN